VVGIEVGRGIIRDRPMIETSGERLIITAASAGYAPALLALLGSLNLNWPGHPPAIVYDIGLDDETLRRLAEHAIPVRKVPAFCPHWREHYTWKLWCMNDAPARDILWMDAGLVVLEPLDEIFDALETQGYFAVPNHQLLDWEGSDEACRGIGVAPEFRKGKPTLAATLMGFRKTGRILALLQEALAVAHVERHVAATTIAHRWEQALLSLLLYKYLGRVVIADGAIYLGSISPVQVPGQKVWVHRRRMLPADQLHFARQISGPGRPHRPQPPLPLLAARAAADLRRVHWYFGQGDRTAARQSLLAAIQQDPTLLKAPFPLARRLRSHDRHLWRYTFRREPGQDFIEWCLQTLKPIAGRIFVATLRAALSCDEALEHYRNGHPKECRRLLIRALRHQPLLVLTDPGLLRLIAGTGKSPLGRAAS
jgi:hypothetical protein